MQQVQSFRKNGDRDRLLGRFEQLCVIMPSGERNRQISAVVEELIALGAKAESAPGGEEDECLREIGEVFSLMVPAGTLQQQMCGELAIAFCSRPRSEISRPIQTHILGRLIDPLITILRIGATLTRDSGVEGLGAILKFDLHPEKTFPPQILTNDDHPGIDPRVDDLYFNRVKRWRLMSLAVAGHPPSLAAFLHALREPLTYIDREYFLDVLYERADLIRTLPAIVRQARDDELPFDPNEFLREAARVRNEDDSPEVVAAFARYQENVFRTIAVVIKRGVEPRTFDNDIANALRTIPRTVFGPPAACNAKVRATVALVRTAIRLIESGDAPASKEALRPLFASLGALSPWSNVGIAEACYRLLTSLLPLRTHNDLTMPALETLFAHLGGQCRESDFAATHRQLLAIGCFRRILIHVSEGGGDRSTIERDIRALLRRPSTAEVIDVFQNHARTVDEAEVPSGIDERVIAGTACERAWLLHSPALFQRWNEFLASDQLLLMRMLAAQIRAARDVSQLARDPFLQDAYGNLPTVSLDYAKRLALIWDLLSVSPPEAAEAIDADLPGFLEHSGGLRKRSGGRLPGNVLAMVSKTVSGRIADVIGREIDLHLRRERQANRHFDFAASLYQVMLREPNEFIFDALLRRVTGRADRDMVVLFRKHVSTVLGIARDHPTINVELLSDLEKSASPTLKKLFMALQLYRDLAGDNENVWAAIVEGPRGGLSELLQRLDDLAFQPHEGQGFLHPRRELVRMYDELAVELRFEVSRYLRLPIDHFESRSAALQHAGDIAARIETALETHEGLRDPERILLIALVRRLRQLFVSTSRRFCDEPRKLKESRDRDAFWAHFVCEDWPDPAPPPFRGQTQQFERYFVEWTSSEFEIDALKRYLEHRWSRGFKIAYGVMTDPARIAMIIVIPYMIAIALHILDLHAVEGIGFLLLSVVAIFGAAVFWFHEPISRFFGRRPASSWKKPYRSQCLYPRMAGLIAAPMILTIEFDHSYSFPLHASSLVLLVLMMLAFMTTQAVITRSIGEDEGNRARVAQIVAVAVTHSFAIAVILSLIFAGSHVEQITHGGHVLHDEHPFLNVLPREVAFDLPEILRWFDREIPWSMAPETKLAYYPTIVLTWTAMGLLIGVVLEGFFERKSTQD